MWSFLLKATRFEHWIILKKLAVGLGERQSKSYYLENAKSNLGGWCGLYPLDSHSKRVKMKHQLEKQAFFTLQTLHSFLSKQNANIDNWRFISLLPRLLLKYECWLLKSLKKKYGGQDKEKKEIAVRLWKCFLENENFVNGQWQRHSCPGAWLFLPNAVFKWKEYIPKRMFQKRKRWVKREVGLLVNRGLHLRGQLVIRWWETYFTKQEQIYQ